MVRSTRAWATSLRARLTPHDLAVLQSLRRVRLLTTRQVRRMHHPVGSPAAKTRRTQRLLNRLHSLELVTRMARRIGGIHSGSSNHVYGLTGLGQAVLDVPGLYGHDRRTTWATKPAFQLHILTVAELFVTLTELERASTAEILTFDAEPASWRQFTNETGGTRTLKPDAFVRIGIGRFERNIFIEVDLATESLPTIRRKCEVFVAYWRTGSEQQRRGVYPQVMWLVPSDHRRRGISEVVQRLVADTRALFTVALLSEAPDLLMAAVSPEVHP